MLTGVYQIACTASGKRYIGSSTDVTKRLTTHRWALRGGIHHSIYLQRSWNKYGESAFEFKPILMCDVDALRYWEKRIVDGLKPEYNTRGVDPERSLTSQSAETRARISAANVGRKRTPEAKAKMSAARMGNTNSLGYKQSEETKSKVSRSLIGNKRTLGYKHTAETKAMMSIARKGKKKSVETRRRMSLAQIGNKKGCRNKADVKV